MVAYVCVVLFTAVYGGQRLFMVVGCCVAFVGVYVCLLLLSVAFVGGA